MGEDLDIVIDRIHGVGHGVGPAAGAAHEDAVHGQVLTAGDAEVAAQRAATEDFDVLAGAGEIGVDQGTAGDIDGHPVFQSDAAHFMDARSVVADTRSIGGGNLGLQRVGEEGEVRLAIDADVKLLRTIDLEGQGILLDRTLDGGALRLDGPVLDGLGCLDDDGLGAFAGEVGYVQPFHSVGTDLLDPDRLSVGGEGIVGAGCHTRNRRINNRLLGGCWKNQYRAQKKGYQLFHF